MIETLLWTGACILCFCLGFFIFAILRSGSQADLHSDIWHLQAMIMTIRTKLREANPDYLELHNFVEDCVNIIKKMRD